MVSVTHNFGSSPSQFSKIPLVENNIIDIVDVRDSNGNKWYHVPYLAQEMVFSDYATSDTTDKDCAEFYSRASREKGFWRRGRASFPSC